MSVSAVTSDPYAYLDQNDPAARDLLHYQPSEKTEADGTKPEKDMALFGEDGFGFDDFLDIINPLQHLPVISNLYREFTGDELSPGARMIGGGLFGGGIGLAASVINTAIEAETGKDVGGHVMALFNGEEDTPDSQLAAAQIPPATGTDPEVLSKSQNIVTPATPSPKETNTPEQALKPEKAALDSTPASVQTEKPKLHMGLQWKGEAPDIRQNIEKLQNLQNKNLSDTQMSQILKAFGNGAAAAKDEAPASSAAPPIKPVSEGTGAYEKQVKATSPQGTDVSGSFDYLDQTI